MRKPERQRRLLQLDLPQLRLTRTELMTPRPPTAVAVAVAADLRAKIKDGTYTGPLPSRRTLMETYGVHAGTATRAARILREEGLVDIIYGVGVYVTGTYDTRPMLTRLTELIHTDGLTENSTLPTERELCERLNVSRPKIRATLAYLEGQGVLTRSGQRRIIARLPDRSTSR
jgi:DNA-binding GntR family transcriptional regulator